MGRMIRFLTPTVMALTLGVAALPYHRAEADAPFPLKSTSVELPGSDRGFPAGPGVEAISANCVTCHSAGMILNQPALSRAAWDTEVHKMVNVYKAPVADADVATIINYLASTKGAASVKQ